MINLFPKINVSNTPSRRGPAAETADEPRVREGRVLKAQMAGVEV